MRVVYNVVKRNDGKWVCWRLFTSRVSRAFDSRADAMIFALNSALKYDYIVRAIKEDETGVDEYNGSADKYADYRIIIFTLNELLREQADITDFIEPLVGLS